MAEQTDNPDNHGANDADPAIFGEEHVEPRDYVYALEVDFDVNSQLMAIGGILHRNRDADQSVRDKIKRSEEHMRRLSGMEAEWAMSDWIDQMEHATYQDAAHSMSAVGMLAPLVETIFYQCFKGIGRKFYPAIHPITTCDRWNAVHSIQWDCHIVVANGGARRDIVQGIFQLSDAIGLTARFPADLKAVLSALFAYRNSMFHHGFEWPINERERFAKRIENDAWPTDWFSVATTNGKPWMFYLSDKFIRHCNETIGQVLQGIGSFVREELLKEGKT